MRFGTGKEAQAFTVNQKEDRLLVKTDSTLQLEKEYALKLIELSSREVKIHQRRLKSKVSRIKSHLSVDEIKEFRNQENQGRFGPVINTVKVSGSFTISAAARRLKLKAERKAAAHGLPVEGSPTPRNKQQLQRQMCDRLAKAVPARNRKSTDTPPVIPGAPATPGSTTPGSTARLAFHFRDTETISGSPRSDDLVPITPKSPKSPKSPKFFRVVASTPKDEPDGGEARRMRPATAAAHSGGPRSERIQQPPRCKSSSGYSSHEVIEKDARDRERSQSLGSARTLTRSQSVVSNGSIDGALAKGRLEERRQTLLDIQQVHTLRLVERKKDFLARVNKWIKQNPTTNTEDPQMSKLMAVLGKDAVISGSGDQAEDVKAEKRLRGSLRHSKSFTAYKERQEKPVEVHWKDLNKCRYLRISEDEIDLSGVVTLAKDQLKMFDAFKRADEEDED